MSLCIALMMTAISCKGILDVDPELCSEGDKKVAGLTVSTSTSTIAVGESLYLGANVVNVRGNWTLCLQPPRWQSSDTTVAVVHEGFPYLDASTAVGVRSGKAYIKATSAGLSDSLLLTVR